jgi:hypothetical protein
VCCGRRSPASRPPHRRRSGTCGHRNGYVHTPCIKNTHILYYSFPPPLRPSALRHTLQGHFKHHPPPLPHLTSHPPPPFSSGSVVVVPPSESAGLVLPRVGGLRASRPGHPCRSHRQGTTTPHTTFTTAVGPLSIKNNETVEFLFWT